MLVLNVDIMETVVRGIDGIKSAIVDEKNISYLVTPETIKSGRDKPEELGMVKQRKINVILTNGTNWSKIVEIPDIDPFRTQSDSVIETQNMLGIRAAYKKIISELQYQIDKVNYKHTPIFATEMCQTGTVTAIEPNGITKREPKEFMLRISDKNPIKAIEEAAAHNLVDGLSGVSGKVLLSQNPRIGTKYNRLMLNEDFVKKNTKTLEDVLSQL